MTKYSWLNKMGLLWVMWPLGSWLWEFDPLVEKPSISSGASRRVKAAHYIQRCAAEASLHSVLPLPFPSFLLFNFPLLWTVVLTTVCPPFPLPERSTFPDSLQKKGEISQKKGDSVESMQKGARWWNERCVLTDVSPAANRVQHTANKPEWLKGKKS